MNRILISLVILVALQSCKSGSDNPDVSNIKVDLRVQRFEDDFFALDTTDLDASLQRLHEKYPGFMQVFVFQVLSGQGDVGIAKQDVKAFIRSYKSLYDSVKQHFPGMEQETATLKRGLQYTRHYFPQYPIPHTLLTFIAPLDTYFMLSDNSISGAMRIDSIFGAGLHLYMGSGFSVYRSTGFQEKYPGYVSRRFSKEYLPVNCIKLLVDDIYPANYKGKPLVEQMIEAGKRLYMVDKLLPEVDDTLKTGYTKAQLEGAYKMEANIWSYFVTNNLLYNIDPLTARDYMNDAPNTNALGPASPGFIGQFVGWQIVKKWMGQGEKNMEVLMKTPAKQIFEEAKYKPA